jgi:hypothetical protein
MHQLGLTPTDVALAAATLVSAVLVASHLLPQPLHAVLAVGVLIAAPAAAAGRALRLADALSGFVAGVAFALALISAISTLLLYLQRWSDANVLVLMTSITLALAGVSSRLRQP